MSQIVRARATRENPYFQPSPRLEGADNVGWLRAGGFRGPRVILLGGSSRGALRVRCAQAHGRGGMAPSHWSHVAIMADEGELTYESVLHHVEMGPLSGSAAPHPERGVEVVPAGAFADRLSWPNVAVIYPDVESRDVASAIGDFRTGSLGRDLTTLAVTWLAFAWGSEKSPTPLDEGAGLPAAVFAETVIGAAGVALTPIVPNGASCPEWIWQAARFWHDLHSEAGSNRAGLEGAYCLDDDLGPSVRSISFIGSA